MEETFCGGNIVWRKHFVEETFCGGNILWRKRFVEKRFVGKRFMGKSFVWKHFVISPYHEADEGDPDYVVEEGPQVLVKEHDRADAQRTLYSLR